MSTMEITFRCMCFFVPDEEAKAVHVLMPSTAGHVHVGNGHGGSGHGGHGRDAHPHPGNGGGNGGGNDECIGNGADPGIAQHVVRFRYRESPDEGVPLESLAVTLGEGGAETTLKNPESRFTNKNDNDHGELVDLSELLGRPIDPRLLTDAPGSSVVSRVTLSGGRVERIDAEARWKLGAKQGIRMANEVVWRIEGLPDAGVTLAPTRLNSSGGAAPDPFPEMKPDEKGLIQVEVFHVTRDAIPPRGHRPRGQVPLDARTHFAAYFNLYDIQPSPGMLPDFENRIRESFTVNCASARGSR